MKPSTSASFLALSCVGSLISAPAFAADATDAQDAPGNRSDIVVSGSLATEVESPKSTAPVVDTPQTVTVVSQEQLRQQNLLTLRDALATIPASHSAPAKAARAMATRSTCAAIRPTTT